jgi:hypothetical protein
MAGGEPPEYGTLVTAALLILALTFAGCWIYIYVGDTEAVSSQNALRGR